MTGKYLKENTLIVGRESAKIIANFLLEPSINSEKRVDFRRSPEETKKYPRRMKLR
jgi:hypothetical protein